MEQLKRSIIMTLFALALSACGSSDSSNNNSSSSNSSSTSISSSSSSSNSNGGDDTTTSYDNQAQKGPFRSGAAVTVTRLDDSGEETEEKVTAEVGESGGFNFPEVSWEGPTLIAIDGSFFDETTGNFSSQSLRLTAIVDLPGEEEANVNLYTHMVAEGVRHYMGEGHDFYGEELRRIVRNALEELTGITSAPINLDLLNAAQNPEEADGANLLLFSAAFLEAGLDASDLAAITEDFQTDGEIDAGGEDAWQRLQLAREKNPDLLNQAVTTLQNQFGSDPPASIRTDAIAWLLSPCQAAKISENRVLCVDDSFYGEHARDNEQWALFVPPFTGHYSIFLSGDPGADDANVNTCRWEMKTTELGDSNHTDGFCGVEDYTGVLQAGERYFIYPRVGKYEDNQPGYFVLSAYRNSDGNATREGAVEMKRFPFEGYVGTHTGASDTAYYRFSAGSAGEHTINVGGYPCAGTSHIRVDLYEAPLDESAPFNSGYSIASSSEEACGQQIEQSLEANRDYFLKITNRTAYMEFSRPAPARTSFSIDIQR